MSSLGPRFQMLPSAVQRRCVAYQGVGALELVPSDFSYPGASAGKFAQRTSCGDRRTIGSAPDGAGDPEHAPRRHRNPTARRRGTRLLPPLRIRVRSSVALLQHCRMLSADGTIDPPKRDFST